MTKVTSNVSVDFPKLGWGINAGDVRELPKDADAAAYILATPGITEVTGKGKQSESAPTEEADAGASNK